jgi:GT2 family glycosyltransferase
VISYFSGFLAQPEVQAQTSSQHITKVAVIIETHEQLSCLCSLLEDIGKQKLYQTKIDIYVVNNATEDVTPADLQRFYFADIRLLQPGKYLGNYGGFYYGLRFVSKLRYDYVWLLDDDVRLDPLALTTLITTLQENHEVGLVGSQIYQLKEPKTIQEFGRLINDGKPQAKINFDKNGNILNDEILKSKPYIRVEDFTDKSLLLRHKIVKHGVFKGYRLHYNDIDLCSRVKQAGWIIAINPSSIIWYNSLAPDFWSGINYDYECSFYYWQKYRPDLL